jgi:hypothetical protein
MPEKPQIKKGLRTRNADIQRRGRRAIESLEAFSPYSRLQVLLKVTTKRVTSRLLGSASPLFL